jgi:Sporulation and spore germination
VEQIRGGSESEQQVRREVLQPVSTPTDVSVKARLYWISAESPSALEPVTVELPLSGDPVERSKQLLDALITKAPVPGRATLPASAVLLAFYLMPDGTAIADLSDEMSAEMPSGILSEQLAVDSIVQTLGAGVSQIRRVKIMIHGQDAETLAGHLDLSGTFPVDRAGTQQTPATPKKPPSKSAP